MIKWRDRKRTFLGLPWSFTVYSYDEEKLYIEKGFLSQSHDEVRLYRILDISYTRTLGQRLFGLGTIHINSSDKTMKAFSLLNIKNVKQVNAELSDLVEKERDRKRVTSREFVGLDEDDFDDSDEA